MAKEGSRSAKRARQYCLQSATGGAQEEVESPLKLMMLGDYTLRADDTPGSKTHQFIKTISTRSCASRTSVLI